MTKKIGKQSFYFANPPVIISAAAIAGPYEGQNSPLKADFDKTYDDPMTGEESFEKAERHLMLDACHTALKKINTPPGNIEFLIAGDLLNQIITAEFSALKLGIPFLGIYGACSNSVEGLILGSILIDGGFAGLVMTATSSHYSSAERQYRYPTEYGSLPKPFSQRTVTGAGTAILSVSGNGPVITHATIGKVTDLACKDPLDMGAAMAPAAVATISQHLEDTGRKPEDFDLILTGDLGKVGYDLTLQWMKDSCGLDISKNFQDCGMMIYDLNQPDIKAGGSGCGCSATVFFGHIYKRLLKKELKRVLFAATGALLSTTSAQQGENIPCIAHAVTIEMR